MPATYKAYVLSPSPSQAPQTLAWWTQSSRPLRTSIPPFPPWCTLSPPVYVIIHHQADGLVRSPPTQPLPLQEHGDIPHKIRLEVPPTGLQAAVIEGNSGGRSVPSIVNKRHRLPQGILIPKITVPPCIHQGAQPLPVQHG